MAMSHAENGTWSYAMNLNNNGQQVYMMISKNRGRKKVIVFLRLISSHFFLTPAIKRTGR
jgi:hypothetical protein